MPPSGAAKQRPGVMEELMLNYPDPFKIGASAILSPSQPALKPVVKPVPPKAEKPLPPPPPPKPKPNLKYCGRILNGGVQSCLVEIGKQQYLMKQGESEGEYTIVKAYEDSIRITFQGEPFTVKLNN